MLTEANGLLYMRARYYSPDLMRFINEDIVTGDISNSNSLNRYSYVEGNPVTMVDPFGLCGRKIQRAVDSFKAGADYALESTFFNTGVWKISERGLAKIFSWIEGTSEFSVIRRFDSGTEQELQSIADSAYYQWAFNAGRLMTDAGLIMSSAVGVAGSISVSGGAFAFSGLTGGAGSLTLAPALAVSVEGVAVSLEVGVGATRELKSFFNEPTSVGGGSESGWGSTKHGEQRLTERGFTQERVDEIVSDYSQKVYQDGGRTVYAKKNGNYYDVIITNSEGEIITAVGGNTRSLKSWKDVERMLNNNGGYSYLPLE